MSLSIKYKKSSFAFILDKCFFAGAALKYTSYPAGVQADHTFKKNNERSVIWWFGGLGEEHGVRRYQVM